MAPVAPVALVAPVAPVARGSCGCHGSRGSRLSRAPARTDEHGHAVTTRECQRTNEASEDRAAIGTSRRVVTRWRREDGPEDECGGRPRLGTGTPRDARARARSEEDGARQHTRREWERSFLECWGRHRRKRVCRFFDVVFAFLVYYYIDLRVLELSEVVHGTSMILGLID